MAMRDVRFDGLRVIGLLAIILAHVNPPALLFQLRNFDVPLMVLVSGAVYGLSSGSTKRYLSYATGRVVRLLIPTWVFLSIFFVLSAVFGKSFSMTTILKSFALLDGIGYVWIIRVFILVALISPFFIYLYQRIKNKTIYLLVVGGVFVLYELITYMYHSFSFLHTSPLVDFFFQNIGFYLLPFGALAGLGLYLLHASKKSIVGLMILSLSIFVYLAYGYSSNGFVPTQVDKYPPGVYYLSYAIGMSLVLYLCGYTSFFQKIFRNKLLLFVSTSSLWIYLWQIFFLYQWENVQQYLPSFLKNFFIEYVMILFFSILCTYVQKVLAGYGVSKLQKTSVTSFLSIAFLK